MSDARILHDFTSRAADAFDRSCTYFLKLVRILGDASRKLGEEEFASLLAALPFDARTGWHFAALAGDPRFATRHAGPDTIAALVALGSAIGAGPQNATPTLPTLKPESSPRRDPAQSGPAENQLRASSNRFHAITGISPEEFAVLAAMPPDTFAAVKAAGLGGWLARRRAEEATSLAITIDPALGFREAAE